MGKNLVSNMEWKSPLLEAPRKLSSCREMEIRYLSSYPISCVRHFVVVPSPEKTQSSFYPNSKSNSLVGENRNPRFCFLHSFSLLFGPYSISSSVLLYPSCARFLRSFALRKPNPGFSIMNKYCDPYNLLHSPGLLPVTSSYSSSHSSSSRPQKNQVRCHPDELAEIIMLIERGEDHMELKLSQMQPNLSLGSVCKILDTLNEHGVSALRFFAWVRKTQPDFILNSKICNLMIDNFGRLDNYVGMLVLLTELSKKGHCLTEKAFGFLAGVRTKDSVKRVVETLNIVKGSCCSSGIYALIKVLCALNSFDQAMFVMQETARKTSYYHVLIAAKCRNGSFQQAHDLFDEMRSSGCDPNTKSYNYLLGSLCKRGRIAEACQLLQVMENLGYLPDSVTYEIFASHACRLGNMDFALKFLHHMMAEGVQPRLTTHAVFIKGYFRSGQVTDAYRYVLEMSSKDKYSRNMNYSLLGRLFHESGRVVEARDILVEMVDKGFKPNFPVYIKVLKDLFKSGMGNLAADLKFRFSKLNSSTDG